MVVAVLTQTEMPQKSTGCGACSPVAGWGSGFPRGRKGQRKFPAAMGECKVLTQPCLHLHVSDCYLSGLSNVTCSPSIPRGPCVVLHLFK